MIWIIPVIVIAYLLIGYAITLKLVKEDYIDSPGEFWLTLLGWLPSAIGHVGYYIIKSILFFPKKFADWHFDKRDNKPSPKVAPPPRLR